MSYNYLFDSYKNVVDKYRKEVKEEGYGLRWITHLDKAGIQIRHVKNMPPLSFGASDKVALTIDNMEGQSFSSTLAYVCK